MNNFTHIFYTIAAVAICYGFFCVVAVLTWEWWHNRPKPEVQVSSDGKKWQTLPSSDVREGWILDPTHVVPDYHTTGCAIRRGQRCSCGFNRNAYMN